MKQNTMNKTSSSPRPGGLAPGARGPVPRDRPPPRTRRKSRGGGGQNSIPFNSQAGVHHGLHGASKGPSASDIAMPRPAGPRRTPGRTSGGGGTSGFSLRGRPMSAAGPRNVRPPIETPPNPMTRRFFQRPASLRPLGAGWGPPDVRLLPIGARFSRKKSLVSELPGYC